MFNHVSIRVQQQEENGVTVTEWAALCTLWSQDEPTHAEPIQALGLTKGATSKVVSRLEENGLAEKGWLGGSWPMATPASKAWVSQPQERPWCRNWPRWPMRSRQFVI